MTLNDLIRNASEIARQFASGDIDLMFIDAITADSHGREIKDIVFDPYAENGQYKINVIFKDMKDHLSDMTNETIILPRCKGKKSSQRFQAIIRCADQMSEDRLIYLCFHASDDEFAEEMEKHGCKVCTSRVCKYKKMEAKKVTYYSLLEQHTNGAWWYHRNTYTSREEAEKSFKIWLTGDFIQKRPRMILEHTDSLPDETMITDDLRRFYNPYNPTELITILCHSQILKQTKC